MEDFIEGLPKSQGFTIIFVVMDQFTKYVYFMALAHPFTAQDVPKEFMQSIFNLHGFPKSIVLDRDSVFLSSFWKGLFDLQGTTLNYSSACHPQGNGQTKALNKALEGYLRCYSSQKLRAWSQWLPLAKWWYINTYHNSTKLMPFEVVYGYPPLKLIEYVTGTSNNDTVNELFKTRT